MDLYRRHGVPAILIATTLLAGGASALSGCATSRSSDGSTSYSAHPINDHQRADLLVSAAAGAIEEGDPTGALQILVDAEKQDAKIPRLHLVRATAYYVKHEVAPAIESVKRAIQLNPEYSEAHNTFGKILLDQGRFAEAEKELLIASKDSLSRDAFRTYTNLGMLYYREGKDAKSLASLDKAIIEGKNSACLAYYYRGHLKLKASQYPDAIRDYGMATKRNCGNFMDAHLALATAYERSRQFDMARKKYLEIRQSFPNTQVAEQAMNRLKDIP